MIRYNVLGLWHLLCLQYHYPNEPTGIGATILYPTTSDDAPGQAIAISDPVLGWQRATLVVRSGKLRA